MIVHKGRAAAAVKVEVIRVVEVIIAVWWAAVLLVAHTTALIS